MNMQVSRAPETSQRQPCQEPWRRWTARNSFVNDEETFYVVVTHKAQTWARNEPGYAEQSYALAVTLEDQNLVQADLHQLLTQQVQVPARLRVRA